MHATTIGLDIAEWRFQIHGVDSVGSVVISKALTRGRVVAFFGKIDPCLIGMKACAIAHHWVRELQTLGHDVRLIPPAYVKPYGRWNKNDAADAAAICEAVIRPCMRFVAVKSAEQQAARSLTRVREQLIAQRTATVNALRGHLAEFGIVEAAGPPRSWRLATIPGIGILTAATFAAAVPDPTFFRSGREFAARLGLVPRQNSTGGKLRLGRISKRGDARLRGLLVVCASSVLQGLTRRQSAAARAPWLARLLESKPCMVVTIALANKLARTVWALMVRNQAYHPERGFLGV